jgi:hypothetical protein
MKKKRRQRRIDGQWQLSMQRIPTGARRAAFWWYVRGRCGSSRKFHKRQMVHELHALALKAGVGGIFTERDMKDDGNIHAAFDNMHKDGTFMVIDDLGGAK